MQNVTQQILNSYSNFQFRSCNYPFKQIEIGKKMSKLTADGCLAGAGYISEFVDDRQQISATILVAEATTTK